VVEGKTRVTYKPREKKPVTEFLKAQGRFRHLFQPGNEAILEEIQKEVDRRWEELLALEEISNRRSETA
jgi:pyruvate ferredoxin oxidoreductase beta subunit